MGIIKTEARPGHLRGVDTSTNVPFVPTVFEVKSVNPNIAQICANISKEVAGSRAVAASDELVAAYYAAGYHPLQENVIVDFGFRDEGTQVEFWRRARPAIEVEFPQYFRRVLNHPEARHTRASYSRWGRGKL
jgi:hypothetical protein